MSENCNSRAFSWLVKSCFPNPQQESRRQTTFLNRISDKNSSENSHYTHQTTFSSLPDDLLLECLSRISPASLPSASLVCRKWSQLLDSPTFYDLRRNLGHLRHRVFAVAVTDFGLYAANHCITDEPTWKTTSLPQMIDSLTPETFDGSFSHTRLSVIGRGIYILGRNATLRYDTWTGNFDSKSPMLFPRKKFAAAVIAGKIYITGGAARTAAVEEYDPKSNKWRVVAEARRRRYGCIGAAIDGVFYVIGGLKIGGRAECNRGAGAEAHVYASSMDLYDVESGLWLRSRAVPGGGCVVAACAASGFLYVLASHAVELSFWRYDGRRRSGGGGFGEWCRMRSPPLPAQVRLDSSVRFSCVGVGEKVMVVQVSGCIDDLLRRSGRSCRGLKEGLVLVYDNEVGEWNRGPDLPEIIQRAACVCVEC